MNWGVKLIKITRKKFYGKGSEAATIEWYIFEYFFFFFIFFHLTAKITFNYLIMVLHKHIFLLIFDVIKNNKNLTIAR